MPDIHDDNRGLGAALGDLDRVLFFSRKRNEEFRDRVINCLEIFTAALCDFRRLITETRQRLPLLKEQDEEIELTFGG